MEKKGAGGGGGVEVEGKLQGAVHLSSGEKCCRITDAGRKGEQLEGKMRKTRMDTTDYNR